jgi:hypothetical protein
MYDYGSDTYKVLTKILKIRFGKELKNSGIELKGLYSMKNLSTNKEFFLLEVNDKQIRFADQKAFIVLFGNFLYDNIKSLKERYNYLIKQPIDEFSDELRIETEYKQVDYFYTQQAELLNKLMDYKSRETKNAKN